jgi:hypothetical protein
MDAVAYVVIPGNKKGLRIGLVKFGESGYYQSDYDTSETEEDCRIMADRLNERMGVTREVAESMFAGSMFGWHCPAAARARIYAEGEG